MSESVRYAGFTVRTECNHCGNPLPLHGPLLSALCPSCLRQAEIPAAVWPAVLEAFDEEHERLRDGEGGVSVTTVDALPVRHEHKKRTPSCEKCGAAFGVEQLPVGVHQDFACTQCGDPASTHPVPEWLRGLVPTARQLYSTDPGAGRTDGLSFESEATIRPIAMACPSCGGSLAATTKSERIMGCRYCQTDVYLPDEVWRRLHPVPAVKEWFLRFEGKTRGELEAEERASEEAERRRREQAQRQAQAERKRRDQEAVLALQARLGLDEEQEIGRMKAYGYVAGLLFAASLGAVTLIGWLEYAGISRIGLTSDLGVVASLAGPLLLLLVALALVARPIQRATGHDFDWMVFCIWFWFPFSLMPLVGQVLSLARALILFRGKFGPATITTNNTSTVHYKAVRLTRGEGRPAALVFLTLGLLYPLMMASLFVPDELQALATGEVSIVELFEDPAPETRGIDLKPPE